MANTRQAKKRVRQAEVHRERNVAQRSLMRTSITSAFKAIDNKDKATAQTACRTAASLIDRMAGKGLIHKNAAARFKSRLNARLRTVA